MNRLAATQLTAIAASILAHVLAAAMLGRAAPPAPAVALQTVELESVAADTTLQGDVQVPSQPGAEPRVVEPLPEPLKPTRADPAPPPRAPSPVDQPRLADSTAAMNQPSAAAPQAVSVPNNSLPRFSVTASNKPTTSTPPAVPTLRPPSPALDVSNPTPIVPEARVSVRAQLLQRGVANYPAAARQAEVEADVELELVVDEQGRVLQARAVKPFGYGFEAAAVQAVRAYRFSPALVDGKAVRVRMRWSVQFRLQ